MTGEATGKQLGVWIPEKIKEDKSHENNHT